MKLVFIYKELVRIEFQELGVYELNRDNFDFMLILFKNMYKTFVLVVQCVECNSLCSEGEEEITDENKCIETGDYPTESISSFI